MARSHPLGHARHAKFVAGTPLGYQPALDGLRAVGAGAVLLYHGGVSWASAGFLGVDVFFVLSGFLITWLLVDEGTRHGSVAVGAFYGRRFRRLAPALLLVVGAVAVYAATAAPEGQLRQLRGDLLATITYVSNWRFVVDGRDYFDQFSAPSPLAHTWSLSVEEQWYVLWPAAMAGMLALAARLRRPAAPVIGTAVLLVASVAWTAVLVAGDAGASRLHFGTDVRAQQLLGGALVALLAHRRGGMTLPDGLRRWADGLGLVALGGLLWAVAALHDGVGWVHHSGLLAVTAATVAVVVAAVQPGGAVRRVLSFEPLRGLGLISYGLYLWHYPAYVVLSTGRTGLEGAPLLLVRLAVTGVLSVASYHLVERPVRDRRWSLAPTLGAGGVALAASVAAVVVLAAGVADPGVADPGDATSAAAGTTVPGPAPAPDEPAGPPDPATIGPLPAAELAALEARAAAATAHAGAATETFDYSPELNPAPVRAAGDDRLRILSTGDSVSITLVQGFPFADPAAVLWDRSIVGCSLFEGERTDGQSISDGGPQCAAWRADRANWIREFDPDVVLLTSGVWELYDRRVDGTTLAFGSPEADRYFAEGLDGLIAELSSGGATVAVVTAPCNQRAESISGGSPPENDVTRIGHLNDLYRAAVDRNPEATLVDLQAFTCPGGVFVAEVGGQAQRSDGVHFTLAGAGRAWLWILPQLLELRAPTAG